MLKIKIENYKAQVEEALEAREEAEALAHEEHQRAEDRDACVAQEERERILKGLFAKNSPFAKLVDYLLPLEGNPSDPVAIVQAASDRLLKAITSQPSGPAAEGEDLH